MPAGKKKASMSEQLGRRITVLTTDKERYDGRFLGYDKDMNIILSDTERTRAKNKGGFARDALGFIVLRGELVASIAVRHSFATARTAVDSLKPQSAQPAAIEGETLSAVVQAVRALRSGPTSGLALN